MSDPKPWPDSKLIARKTLGAFLLITTVGLATCQSVFESVLAAPVMASGSSTAASGVTRTRGL